MKKRHSYSTRRHRLRRRRGGGKGSAAGLRQRPRWSLVSLSGSALHDLFSTRHREGEGERAHKRERERKESDRPRRPGMEYRNFNIKQRAIECRSNLPGKRSPYQSGQRMDGTGASSGAGAGGRLSQLLQFVSTLVICICSFPPQLPNEVRARVGVGGSMAKGERARGWARGRRAGGWREGAGAKSGSQMTHSWTRGRTCALYTMATSFKWVVLITEPLNLHTRWWRISWKM